MCAPDYFDVSYIINPWMHNQVGNSNHALAVKQWNYLRDALAKQVNLIFVAPEKGVPDMVFTANAGLVLGDKVIISRFRSKERQPEEPYFRKWFADRDFKIADWPQSMSFEGAGDALFDRGQQLLWIGHGFRSDAAAPAEVEKIIGRRTATLRLIDPRFYHLDTCLCPLEGGYLIYYPQAFDQASQDQIAAFVP
jgi:N-dimethylarginine dimethylaminohydrolase